MKAVILVRDGFVIDGIWPFQTWREWSKARGQAERELQYNRRNYQGSWMIGTVQNFEKGLKSYCRAVFEGKVNCDSR